MDRPVVGIEDWLTKEERSLKNMLEIPSDIIHYERIVGRKMSWVVGRNWQFKLEPNSSDGTDSLYRLTGVCRYQEEKFDFGLVSEAVFRVFEMSVIASTK